MFDTTVTVAEKTKTKEELLIEWFDGEMSVELFKNYFNEDLLYFDNKSETIDNLLNELIDNEIDEAWIDTMWELELPLLKDNGWKYLSDKYPEIAEDINSITQNGINVDLTFSPWKRTNTDSFNRNPNKRDSIYGIGYKSMYVNQMVETFGYGKFDQYLIGQFENMTTDEINDYVDELLFEHIGTINPLEPIELI